MGAHSSLVIAYDVPAARPVVPASSAAITFDRLNSERLTRYHTKRLAALGYTLTLAKHAA